MEERQLTSRGGSLKLNLGMIGVVGVQKESLFLMVLVFQRTIRQGWPTFSKSIQFEVGVGKRIKFWHHVWCGGCTFQEAILELYNISCNKESSIEDVMHFPNQRLHWDLQFSRAPQDWET